MTNQNQMCQADLYQWICMLGFCAYDMLLYMDTHPDDENALNYYNECNNLYNSAKQTYETKFKTLDILSDNVVNCWDWNTMPMPWEGGR